MKYLPWKHALLAGSFALFALSGTGSSATAGGRPYDPALMPMLAPFVFQTHLFADGGALSPSAYPAQGIVTVLASEPAAAELAETAQPAAEQQLPQPEPQLQPQAAPAASAAVASAPAKPKAASAASDTAKKAQPNQAKKAAPAAAQAKAATEAKATAKQPSTNQPVVTVAGKEIKPAKTIAAVASAYTGSAEENGGYAGLDYFGNTLKVGTIAVDPKVIPLGTTVYVTGYTFDGLPAGGMMAVASDTGGSIKGNRIDIFVPSSGEQAKLFGYQNVTVYVVD
ncbi:3D domain-containing protein [Paenibacillus sp. GYB004]|uniref:3D domain-containing protein n=1 Tax=Paenibacillus sp. GYB004 TaxID=2994393 RepID=UPI002F96B9F0